MERKKIKNDELLFKKFDLFNSKYNCRICRQRLRSKADEIIHSMVKHSKLVS